MPTPKLTAYVVDSTITETVTVRTQLPDGTLDKKPTVIRRKPKHRGDLLTRSEHEADLTVLPAGSYEIVNDGTE